MLRVAYAVVDSTPIIFVSDSVDSVDSGMSSIVIESNNCIYFSNKWYLEVFETADFLAETLEKLRKYQNLTQGYQVSTNLQPSRFHRYRF